MNITQETNEINQVEAIKGLLEKNNLKISVAESCTGGNLQALLTSISGSSKYFEGGICCYTIDQKVKHLGVDRSIAEPVDCVSQEVADQMAISCYKLFETNISISTTGFIQSHLYYSICFNNKILFSDQLDLRNYVSRKVAQEKASEVILNVLIKLLNNQFSPNNII